MAAYFVLLSRESAAEPWCQQFGDHCRDTVEMERVDSYLGDPAELKYKARNLKIIKSNSARQSCVDYCIAELNRVRTAIDNPSHADHQLAKTAASIAARYRATEESK